MDDEILLPEFRQILARKLPLALVNQASIDLLYVHDKGLKQAYTQLGSSVRTLKPDELLAEVTRIVGTKQPLTLGLPMTEWKKVVATQLPQLGKVRIDFTVYYGQSLVAELTIDKFWDLISTIHRVPLQLPLGSPYSTGLNTSVPGIKVNVGQPLDNRRFVAEDGAIPNDMITVSSMSYDAQTKTYVPLFELL